MTFSYLTSAEPAAFAGVCGSPWVYLSQKATRAGPLPAGSALDYSYYTGHVLTDRSSFEKGVQDAPAQGSTQVASQLLAKAAEGAADLLADFTAHRADHRTAD